MTSAPRARRAYIDWLRGVAVVVMIFAHTMDSWTRRADRDTLAYDLVVKIAGIGAPLFLFLAGVAVALSGAAKVRKGATAAQAAAMVRRRGWEILGLAFLFRLQAWTVSPGSSIAGLLKVDILNIMGPAMVIAATIWGWSARFWPRAIACALIASAFSFLTPFVRASEVLGLLPDPLEWYLRPPPNRSWFALFPWAGLLVAGTIVGECIDRSGPTRDRRLAAGLAIGGATLFAVSFVGSHLPSPFAETYFWTTGPSYFFLRIGLMTAMLAGSWAWCRRFEASPATMRGDAGPAAAPGGLASWRGFSPLLQFGHTSLFVYWIHVEMVYGYLTWPLHRKLPIGWAFIAFLAFAALMLVASIVKDRVVARWKARGAAAGNLSRGSGPRRGTLAG